MTQAITQYGTYVSVSDQLELHAIDDVILGAAEELGASAGTTQDKLLRNVAAAGTNVQYCDKVGTNGAHTAVTQPRRSGHHREADTGRGQQGRDAAQKAQGPEN